jgi:4'-phosphopantetheinyl transferase
VNTPAANAAASQPGPLDLADDEVHLWLCSIARVGLPATLARCDRVQSDAERARGQRFVFERDRRRHVITRGLVRSCLSHYADVAPADWRFVENSYGCPQIERPLQHGGLHVNLSHSGDLIACLVGRHREFGVDVQEHKDDVDVEALARSVFSPSELKGLERLPDLSSKDRRFFQLWTLKEAYIKARRMGLSLALDQFSFDLDNSPSSLTVADELHDPVGLWWHRSYQPKAGYHLAMVVEERPEESIQAVVRWVEPTASPAGETSGLPLTVGSATHTIV